MPVTDLNGLEQCEKEPLANSGLIQPNGVLLFIEKVSGQIRYVSENAANLLGQEPDELLDLDGKDWLEQILPDLVSWPASAGRRMHFPAVVDLGFGELDVLISGTSAGWLIEFEASQPTSIDFAAIRLARPQGPIISFTMIGQVKYWQRQPMKARGLIWGCGFRPLISRQLPVIYMRRRHIGISLIRRLHRLPSRRVLAPPPR
jgi:hypothetical protein